MRRSYLYRDDDVEPVLGQVDLGDEAAVGGSVGQEDNGKSPESIGHDAGTEQEEDHLLEPTPLTQESYRGLKVLHGLPSRCRCPVCCASNERREKTHTYLL